jgi:hypothetical protein
MIAIHHSTFLSIDSGLYKKGLNRKNTHSLIPSYIQSLSLFFSFEADLTDLRIFRIAHED